MYYFKLFSHNHITSLLLCVALPTCHTLLIAEVKLKLKRIEKKQRTRRLKNAEVQKQFQLQLSNSFSTLEDDAGDDEDSMERRR